MAGQQKEWKEYVLYKLTSRSIKRRRKRKLSREKQVPTTTKEDKKLQKDYIYKETTLGDKRKMSKQTNDLSQPFQERKRHRGKEKNH